MAAEGTRTPGSPLETLLDVQDLDTAITQLQHRKASLPERREVADLEASLAALGRRGAEAATERAELARQQADLETQIATTTSRQTSIEQRLYAARGGSARDLQAMDDEIRHLRERREQLEEQELEIMVALEPVDQELAEVEAERARLSAVAEAARGALATVEAAIDADLSERATARDAAAGGLPEELKSRYDALRHRLGGTGAARLVGSRCSGCHLELPSMEVDRIRHVPPGTVVICEQCGRILVPTTGAASRADASSPRSPG